MNWSYYESKFKIKAKYFFFAGGGGGGRRGGGGSEGGGVGTRVSELFLQKI